MAKRKEGIPTMEFIGGKMVSVVSDPLKPNDVEAWAKGDFEKAQSLLESHFPYADNDNETVNAMVEMLRTKIGQDFEAITDTVVRYFKEKI